LSKIQIGRNLDHRPTRGNDGLSIDQVVGPGNGPFHRWALASYIGKNEGGVKIYTRTGDEGATHSLFGSRVLKDDPFVEACGTVDELNALLGLARAESLPTDIDSLLDRVQHELFGLGADLAMMRSVDVEGTRMGAHHVGQLEQEIDAYEEQLPVLREFILPGGGRAAATVHVARTVCRRAERRVVAFGEASQRRAAMVPAIRYLNRLGDLLFVLARVINARQAIAEHRWQKETADSSGTDPPDVD
jgi:cob(I)alamin adenosyltransferase